jgi:hypothetical protein
MMRAKGGKEIMGLRTMGNNVNVSLANVEKSTRPGRHTSKKGSPVTEERAKAQRAKLNAQAEARQREEEQEAAASTTQNKKTARQEIQAKRRTIET